MNFDAKESAIAMVNTCWKICESERNHELADILKSCNPIFKYEGHDNWDGGIEIYSLQLEVTEQLFGQIISGLSNYETDTTERIQHIFGRYAGLSLSNVKIVPQLSSSEIHQNYSVNPKDGSLELGWDELIGLVDEQVKLLVGVSEFKVMIDDVNDQYKENRIKLGRALRKRNIPEPKVYKDLWEWHAHYSRDKSTYSTYAARRAFVGDLFEPLNKILENKGIGAMPIEPTGWVKVDLEIGEVWERLEASTEDVHFNQVGVTCRVVLLSLAHEVYNPEIHSQSRKDGTKIGKDDVIEMLGALLDLEVSGRSNKELRQYAKSSLTYAHKITHAKSSTYREAALCAEATRSVINLIAIIAGRRDPH